MTALLQVEGLQAQYGLTKVLHGVDCMVEEGGITTILGANGAGKTTLLRSVCGMVKTSGSIHYAGQRIDGKATEDIVRLGIGHVPEGRGTFVALTVEENLRLGAYTRKDKDHVQEDYERVHRYFPVLLQRRQQQAGTLSGGEQQMLAIGRAMMARPRLLILDEPSLGLAPLLVEELFAIIKSLNEEDGITVLLAEQNAGQAVAIAHYGYVLETGHLVLEDTAENLLDNEAVRSAYLGF